ALGLARPPAVGNVLELAQLALLELVHLGDRRGEASLLEPGDRLAHLADRPPLQRELARLDHGLVADVERSHALVLPERKRALAGAEHRELESAGLRERAPVAGQFGHPLRRPD